MPLKKFHAMAVSTLLMTACINENIPENEGVSVGDPLPDFSIVLNTGQNLNTEALRGKVSAIIFFNTSCSDCRKELPVVQELYDTFKENSEVTIFAVSREEGSESVERYWSVHNLTIPFCAQSDRLVYNKFAISGIPRIYVSDKNLEVTAIFGDYPLPDLSELSASVTSAIFSE